MLEGAISSSCLHALPPGPSELHWKDSCTILHWEILQKRRILKLH